MKVYIIGDSFGTEDNIKLYNDLCEEDDILFEGSEKFEYRDGFDVVLIDFGDISNYDEQNNLEVIEKYLYKRYFKYKF